MGRSGAQYAQLGAQNLFTQFCQFLGGARLNGMQWNRAVKTGAYTVTGTDIVILADATAGAFTVSIPLAGNTSKVWVVKKTDASANAVTVAGVSGTIDGAASFGLPAQNNAVTVMSDNVNGWTLGKV